MLNDDVTLIIAVFPTTLSFLNSIPLTPFEDEVLYKYTSFHDSHAMLYAVSRIPDPPSLKN
jgi:hypothetical protein